MTTFRHRACVKKQANLFNKIVRFIILFFVCLFSLFVVPLLFFVAHRYYIVSLLFVETMQTYLELAVCPGLQVIGSMPIAFIAVAPTGKASFVYDYVQTRLVGQYNGK